MNIAIFASGSGTNAENIIRYFHNHPSISVKVVLSNKPEAGALKKAQALGVKTEYFTAKDFAETNVVLDLLEKYDIDFVVLAGFLLRVPNTLLQKYEGHMVNIHPSLLPKFGGKGMYGIHVHEAVVAAGETESGITIHWVSNLLDEGEIIFQAKCPVLTSDNADDVAARIHLLEMEHFPRVIERVISGK